MAETAQQAEANPQMAFPQGITRHHVEGRQGLVRGFLPLAALGALLIAALLGLFGGTKNETLAVAESGAALQVNAPQTLRNGMFFEIDIGVEARAPIAKPVVTISRDYLHDITVNTSLPEPKDMGFENDSFTLTYPAMKAGDRLMVKLDGQVNPTLVGRNRGAIAIRDDKRVLAEQPVHIMVLP